MKKIFSLILVLCAVCGYSQNEVKQEDNMIYSANGIDVKPEFPGGLKQLNAIVNEEYRKAGFESEVKGKVYAMFVVEKDGSLTDVKILRRIDAPKAKALVLILTNLPKWTPGKQNGNTVRVLYSVVLEIGT